MMDELTRRLRDLMKPIANWPLLEVEGLHARHFGRVWINQPGENPSDTG